MALIAYVNGRYLPLAHASVHIEDRGYQFSDGVYEYMAFYRRTPLDEDLHLHRLEQSLNKLQIAMPVTRAALKIILRELIARNRREHGGIYIQVTRGVSRRDHPFPRHKVKPALVVTICAPKFPKPHEIKDGVGVITQPDLRWGRRDIKTVSLLANILAKQESAKRNLREAWLVQDGKFITEGSASNAYIVNAAGEIITHPADNHILAGITREVVLKLAKKHGIAVIEKPFTLADIKKAAEAFLTSTSPNVLSVVKVDDITVGNGKPGKITRRLQELHAAHVLKETGYEAA